MSNVLTLVVVVLLFVIETAITVHVAEERSKKRIKASRWRHQFWKLTVLDEPVMAESITYFHTYIKAEDTFRAMGAG